MAICCVSSNGAGTGARKLFFERVGADEKNGSAPKHTNYSTYY